MDILGYDSWRLAAPDYGYEEDFDDTDLREAAVELAEELIEDDSNEVEQILLEDETWQVSALSCAMGNIDQDTLKMVILDIIAQNFLDYREEVVIEHATVTMRDRDEH